MTTRRMLGTGPEDSPHIRAVQADLLPSLPGIRLPDLDELRARGVLGAPTGPGHPHRGRTHSSPAHDG
ncbi:hypothetical protein [Streptomyces misionensis]|uniref:hypothetical protein n=1 Tax=Streptomyces misionensis TaxID=67331 RepID=UPI0033F03F38